MTTTLSRPLAPSRTGLAAQTALAAVLWGSVGPLVALYPTGAVAGFAVVRLTIGSVLLGLFALQATRRSPFTRADIPTLLVGGLSVAAFQPLYFAALERTGVTVATFVAIGLSPVITGLALWASQDVRPSQRWWIAAGVAVVGLATLCWGSAHGTSKVTLTGIVLACAACASYALQALTIDRLAGTHGDTRAVGAIFVVATLMLLPTAPFADYSWASSPLLLLGAVYAGVATLAVSYRLFARGVHGLGSPTAVMISLLEPVAAAVLAVLLIGEDMPLLVVAGSTLILAGVVLSVLDERPPQALHPVV